jgi:acetyltransferase-like isoleucine patch superfamily enzyme
MLKKIILLICKSEIEYGSNAIIDWNVKINNNRNRLIIGKNVYLRSIQKGYQAGMPFPTNLLIDVKNATIQIGNNTRINGAYIHAQKSICIGENCVIASGVNIIDSNGHNLYSTNRTIGRDTPKDIKIGNNVWIGLNAVILKNTNIGNNSVISAGSVVKGDFPPNSLIVGNPGILVKKIEKNENRYSQ